MGTIKEPLAKHEFEYLFVECLGWDRFRHDVEIREHDVIQLKGVAQKRGFAVFVCSAHRTHIANRRYLRNVQRQLRKQFHEHILIHYCETPRKQVWQWAFSGTDGRKVLHREHPFFSDAPPPRLLARLKDLAVSIDDEETTGLTDILCKVRTALLPDNEFDLFSKYPWYAEKSDRLAVAMRNGDADAFSKFVEFHMPLARKSSRMLVRWVQMDPDDAEQIAMIGLIEAARRFDPERGFQFSTYAGYWIRLACQRYGLDSGMHIRVPVHIFWRCYKLSFERTRLIATHGEHEGTKKFQVFRDAEGVSAKQWDLFWTARHVEVMSDLAHGTVEAAKVIHESNTVELAITDEVRTAIHQCLKTLSERQATILRLRYGFGGQEHTLQEIAEQLGITRERVRQIQVKAEEKLERHIAARGYGESSAGASESPATDAEESLDRQSQFSEKHWRPPKRQHEDICD